MPRGASCPAIGLPDAIKKVKLVYNSEVGDALADKSVIASAMRYSRTHGAFYIIADASMQYGLLEVRGDQFKVSTEALKILQFSEKKLEEYKNAVRKAAFAPPLFDELHRRYDDALPDVTELREFFTEKGLSGWRIDQAIPAYRDTIQFVNKQTENFSKFSGLAVSNPQIHRHISKSGLPLSSSLGEKKERETDFEFRDSGGFKVQVTFNGPVTSERLQELIDFVQFQKKLYLKKEETEH